MRLTTRMGSLEIELRSIGSIHLKLVASDEKHLIDFIKYISNIAHSPGSPGGDGSLGVQNGRTHSGGSLRSGERITGKLLEKPAEVDSVVEKQVEAVGDRISKLEERIDDLIDVNKQLADSLKAEKHKTEPRVPSPGTKYHQVLQELLHRWGRKNFESNQVSVDRRHVLSILSNKYNALEVVGTRGRTNIYRIRKDIMHRILADSGTSNIIEIRGKDRESCDVFLERSQKRYPGFTYVFLEGVGLRQRYRLFFKDSSIQLSVTASLGRFVENKTNLIIREA